jgi:anti-sigma B factor antagonist
MDKQAIQFKTISVSIRDNIDIVTVIERRVFMQITDTFREELVSVVEKGIDRLIIDLSQVSIMNSSAIGVLILARDKLKKRNGGVILCGMQHLLAEIFSRMHLDSFFKVAPDIESALILVNKSSGGDK